MNSVRDQIWKQVVRSRAIKQVTSDVRIRVGDGLSDPVRQQVWRQVSNQITWELE